MHYMGTIKSANSIMTIECIQTVASLGSLCTGCMLSIIARVDA